MAIARAQTGPFAVARRRARSSLVALSLVAVGLGGASFALHVAKQQPSVRKNSAMNHQPRANLRDRVELRDEEPEAPAPELPPLPEKRVPYGISLFAHKSDSNKGLSQRSRELIIERVKAALENTQEWIRAVEVRVTIDHHMHKAPTTATAVMEDDGVFVKEGRQQSAPYMIEVTVHMEEGKPVVLSNQKHAQVSLTAALDDMYDFLRRQMRKEKERRVDQIRRKRQQQQFEIEELDFLYGEGQLDDDALLINPDYALREEARLEAVYKAVEEAREA